MNQQERSSVVMDKDLRKEKTRFDDSLAIKLGKGDSEAFKSFFEGFYPSVCVFSHKYLKEIELAEDFAQEAFVEYWLRKENFTDLNAIKGYIYTVARNKSLNHIKSKRIRESILNAKLYEDSYFYELILEEETYRIFHQAVYKLAPQTQKVIWLSLEGHKNHQIADAMDVSVNTVKTLKKNAYKELRVNLKDHIFILFLLSRFLN